MNVVLISMDSVRQDHVGAYGHRPEFAPDIQVTPHLDALAQEGVVFDEAWATTSWTLPSHMTILTGLSDATHGVVHDFVRLDPLRHTLAEQFSAAGYATAGFYSGPYLDQKYGFEKGFDYYASGMMPDGEREAWMQARSLELAAAKRANGQPDAITPADISGLRDRLSHEDITSPRINEQGLTFLDTHGDEPFFLFLHYFDAHYDHIPDKAEPGLGERFDPSYAGNFPPDRWYFNPAVRTIDQRTGRPTQQIGDRDLRHIMAMYDAEIHWVDRHIGEIVQKLKDLGVYDNTIIAVISDHGDEFFEHGNIGHRTTLFAEVLKIPFILRVPDEARAGARVEELVRTYDLAPSLLDYAGLGEMPEAEGQSVRSFVDALDSDAAQLAALGHLTQLGRVNGNMWRAQTQEVWRDDRFTLLRIMGTPAPFAEGSTEPVTFRQSALPNGMSYMFFDRENDPFERQPLTRSHPEYKAAIQRFMTTVRAQRAHRGSLPQSAWESRYPQPMTQEELTTLIALGYLPANTKIEDAQTTRVAPFGLYPVPAQDN